MYCMILDCPWPPKKCINNQAVNRPSNTDSTCLLITWNNYSMPKNVYDLDDFVKNFPNKILRQQILSEKIREKKIWNCKPLG